VQLTVERAVRLLSTGFVFVLLLAHLRSSDAPHVTITASSPTGIYRIGERAEWTVRAPEPADAIGGELDYELSAEDGKPPSRGRISLAHQSARISGTRSSPGTLLLRVHGRRGDSKQEWNESTGVVFSPERIAPSMGPPPDFDQFWARKIDALRRTSTEVTETPAGSGRPSIDYSVVEIRAPDGINVRGQLGRPAEAGSLPALLLLNGAGVFRLSPEWVLEHAARGWLVFNISAHDLPVDAEDSFYQQLAATTLADYAGAGSESRETNYFLKVILRCHRAVDFLQGRPEWNHETLLVSGHSQGGWMALAVAALHPAVTLFAANVPAGCDHTAPAVGRLAPWPNWASRWTRNRAALTQASRYFDAVNFARSIRVPGLVGVALADVTCPPDGIFAAVNQLRGPKEIIVMPGAGHGGDHRAFEQAFSSRVEKNGARSKTSLPAVP
jgi:cephalosporin-C deacetylase-like acetyl esterase